MSKNQNTNAGSVAQSAEAVTAVTEPVVEETAVAVAEPTEDFPYELDDDGIPITKDGTYLASDYAQGAEFKDSLDISKFLLRPSSNLNHLHFAWQRWDQLERAKTRYFIKVQPHLHGKLFKPEAFNKVHKAITAGFCNNNMPELYLHVRSQQANQEEIKQMLELSQQSFNPDTNEQAQGLIAGIAGAIGQQNLRGPGVERYVETPKWAATGAR